MPMARLRALARDAPATPAAAPPKPTPTARPSGKLCSVTANTRSATARFAAAAFRSAESSSSGLSKLKLGRPASMDVGRAGRRRAPSRVGVAPLTGGSALYFRLRGLPRTVCCMSSRGSRLPWRSMYASQAIMPAPPSAKPIATGRNAQREPYDASASSSAGASSEKKLADVMTPPAKPSMGVSTRRCVASSDGSTKTNAAPQAVTNHVKHVARKASQVARTRPMARLRFALPAGIFLAALRAAETEPRRLSAPQQCHGRLGQPRQCVAM
mmetsp:Transcript_14974/g.44725  ORF Transcript_14974/g.44725 Transcript_14974/m.44725 type:complete len:270 (-) Transcript_14974:37-846(-)